MEEPQIIPMVQKRKLMASGTAVVVTIPKEWLAEHSLKPGAEIIMIKNGDLIFKPITEENINKIRNQLTHATRPDEERMGEKAKALVNQKGTIVGDSKSINK